MKEVERQRERGSWGVEKQREPVGIEEEPRESEGKGKTMRE